MALNPFKKPTKADAPPELGRPSTEIFGFGQGAGLLPWALYMEDREAVPDLIWPQSVNTYQAMQSDAQIKGLLMAMGLPIRRFRWEIIPNEARQNVIDHVAEAHNLPVQGQDPRPVRRRNRFDHDRHIAHALRAPAQGHMHFEEVYEYRDPAEGGDGLLHLKKLGSRPPRTIQAISVEQNGDLKAIVQMGGLIGAGSNAAKALGVGIGGMTGITIDADRLLTYLWDTEDDGDQVGRSMLRACYRDWIIKDRLLRVDATKHERNGMGIPWFEVDPSASAPQIEALGLIAEEIRSGERSGGAGPGKLRIVGTEGLVPDTIGSVRYHDQQMSRSFLALFFDLGTTETGSRALGAELLDFYSEQLGATADWYSATLQTQIEKEVEMNWGEDEQPPALGFTRLETQELSLAELTTAVEKELIEVDDELRSYIVQRWKLPKQPEVKEPEPPPAPTIVLPPGGPPSPDGGEEAEGEKESPAPASPARSPRRSPAPLPGSK